LEELRSACQVDEASHNNLGTFEGFGGSSGESAPGSGSGSAPDTVKILETSKASGLVLQGPERQSIMRHPYDLASQLDNKSS